MDPVSGERAEEAHLWNIRVTVHANKQFLDLGSHAP